MDYLLKIDHVKKFYGSDGFVTKALNSVDFNVQKGEFIAIMGPSGSGKTTLLNCIATIDTVSAGHIFLDGTDTTELNDKDLARFRRQKLGFVFQEYNLLDTLTVGENIALTLSIDNKTEPEVSATVREISQNLGIQGILEKYPYEISGGEKQRCACARAIANYPSVILADEPTGALDSRSSQMLMDTIRDMNDKLGATILLVTHDAFTASYAKRILFLRDGDIYTEIIGGSSSRKDLFGKILDVMAMLGGDLSDVR